MAEEEKKPDGRPAGRPAGRPQGKATKKDEVYKRGEGLGTGKVGNVDYSERTESKKTDAGSGRQSPLDSIGGMGGHATHGSVHPNNAPHGGIPHAGTPNGALGGKGQGVRPQNLGPAGPVVVQKKKGISLFKIFIIVLIVLFVMNMLGMCGGGSSGYDDDQDPNGSQSHP